MGNSILVTTITPPPKKAIVEPTASTTTTSVTSTTTSSKKRMHGSCKQQQSIVILDGGTGREIERRGGPFRQPEWSALALKEAPKIVQQVHESFLQAGATAITTNSYAVVPFHLTKEAYQQDSQALLERSVHLVHQARTIITTTDDTTAASSSGSSVQVVGSIPPICGSYEPDKFDANVAIPILKDFLKAYQNQVDVLLLETLGSVEEARCYLSEIQQYTTNSQSWNPSIWISFCVGSDYGMTQVPKLLTGTSLTDAVQTVWKEFQDFFVPKDNDDNNSSCSVAFMVNCCDLRLVSASIQELVTAVESIPNLTTTTTTTANKNNNIRIGAYPNAFSIPPPDAANHTLRPVDYNITPAIFQKQCQEWISLGATILGGCCGVGPEHIQALKNLLEEGEETPKEQEQTSSNKRPKTITTANDNEEDNEEQLFFVGSYTQVEGHVPNGCGDGIYSFVLNSQTGAIRHGPVTSGTTHLPLTNPTYLHYNSTQQRLYAIEEMVGASRPAHVISYQVDTETASLTELSRQDSKTQAGCHLTMMHPSSSNGDSENYLLTAAYVSGNLVVATVHKDGTLQSQMAMYQYHGKGTNPDRQEAPHAHQVVVSPDEKFIYVCDLETDTIWCHDVEPLLEQLHSQQKQQDATTIILPAPTKAATCPPGSGPRHLVFHPTAPRQVYVLSELSGMILSYRQDPTTGGLDLIHQVSSLPSEKSGSSSESGTVNHDGEPGSAAIRIHPSGKALYVSNRGKYNHIVVIPISTADDDDSVAGSLDMAHASWIPSGGKTPRDFALDKSGKWMIVGNQDDDTLAVFSLLAPDRVDTNHPQTIPCKSPACITFSC